MHSQAVEMKKLSDFPLLLLALALMTLTSHLVKLSLSNIFMLSLHQIPVKLNLLKGSFIRKWS